MKLKIELIPKTCWGTNLRTKLKKSDWDKIRKGIYEKEKMCCHICGVQCKSLDAHEVWEFDEENHVQRLVDIIGICKACHNTIHYGRAKKIGHAKEALEQFIEVNNCTKLDFGEEMLRVESDWHRRNKINDWKLDVSLIEEKGYFLKRD